MLVNFDVTLNITCLSVTLERLAKLARGLVTDWFDFYVSLDLVVVRGRNYFVYFALKKWSSHHWRLVFVKRGRLHMESLGEQGRRIVVGFSIVTTSFLGLKSKMLTVHINGQVSTVLKSVDTLPFPRSLLPIMIVYFAEQSNSFFVVVGDPLHRLGHDLEVRLVI